jgi:hypothetical protein
MVGEPTGSTSSPVGAARSAFRRATQRPTRATHACTVHTLPAWHFSELRCISRVRISMYSLLPSRFNTSYSTLLWEYSNSRTLIDTDIVRQNLQIRANYKTYHQISHEKIVLQFYNCLQLTNSQSSKDWIEYILWRACVISEAPKVLLPYPYIMCSASGGCKSDPYVYVSIQPFAEINFFLFCESFAVAVNLTHILGQ